MIGKLYMYLGPNSRRRINQLIITMINKNIFNKEWLPINFRNYILGQKMFNYKRKLNFNETGGYFEIVPKFSEKELLDYYKSLYWVQYRSDGEIGISTRDLIHYNLILSKSNDFFKTKRTIVNFGSGHGGISFLFYFSGHNVINIEPDDTLKNHLDLDPGRWIVKKSIKELEEKFDLFYSSHSLEHVHDINQFMEVLGEKINRSNDLYVFFEVPDGEHPLNGGASGKIVVPHTYYFLPKFFKNLPFKKIHLSKDNRILRYFGFLKSLH